jgi:hypothetical protein
MNGYDHIKTLKRRTGMKISDLLVLAPNNDPFYAGQPAQHAQAQWFAHLWERFSFARGVHLRRIHYLLVSQPEPIIGFNGKPYENTIEDWNRLGVAAKAARYLGMVPADAFEDHRNPDPYLHVEHAPEPLPGIDIDLDNHWLLPTISAELGADINADFPQPIIYGYEYRDCDQPYHLEVWIEKSTMNDVLLPICRRYGVNLVTSVGFQSITSAIHLIKRATQSGKPARVFYISDFDPAGDFMPQSVARQIEYWVKHYAPSADIALQPLALTRPQVVERQLPRIPIKESDLRRSNFEDCYGEGAVELDALETLYPGDLGRLLTEAIIPYRDPDIKRTLDEVEQETDEWVAQSWQMYTEQERAEAEAITAQAQAVYEAYRERLEALKRSLDTELAPLQERLDSVWQAIKEKAEGFFIDLPDRPQSELPSPDEAQWLFHSKRKYFEQLNAYKVRRSAGGAA